MSCFAIHVLCVSLVITHTAINLVIIPRSSCLRCTVGSCRCNAVARLFCCCLLQTETLAVSTATVGATRSRTGQSFARTTSETIHAGAGACVQSERRDRREEKRREKKKESVEISNNNNSNNSNLNYTYLLYDHTIHDLNILP